MRAHRYIIHMVLALTFASLESCIDRMGSTPGDSERPIYFFLRFVDPNTGEDYFRDKDYDPNSFIMEYFEGNKSISNRGTITYSYHGEDLILGSLLLAELTGGLSEPGVIVRKGPFIITAKLFFSENDIDTIHCIVTCGDNCNYEEKTLEMYYNGNLILDLDFSGKDSLLLEELLDNNRPWEFEYGEDTVVFVIEKIP